MMDQEDNVSDAVCKLCGEGFTLREDEADSNLPRVLLCGHIYCTSCLMSIQRDGAIRCPECEVESTLPEVGVLGLQEDSRIIGLMYTSKMNRMKRCERSKYPKRYKSSLLTDSNHGSTEEVEQTPDMDTMKKSVDEALVRAAENLALLENIYKLTFQSCERNTAGMADQVKRERARLEREIKQAADKALHAVQKWKDVQLSKLPQLEEVFSTSQAEVCCVQRRMKTLEIAMQMVREVFRVPYLEKYCTLDQVLETLQAPVDNQSFDMKCITMGSGLSCVFRSESLNQSLALSLKMDICDPKHLSESEGPQSPTSNRESPRQSAKGRNRKSPLLPTPPKQDQEMPGAKSPSSRGSSPSPPLRHRASPSRQSPTSDPGTPDVIVEELIIEGEQNAPPPTGPELDNDKWRVRRRKKNQSLGNLRNGRECQSLAPPSGHRKEHIIENSEIIS